MTIISTNTSKKRTHSLFRQGTLLYELIPMMPEPMPFMESFENEGIHEPHHATVTALVQAVPVDATAVLPVKSRSNRQTAAVDTTKLTTAWLSRLPEARTSPIDWITVLKFYPNQI
jgi:hypothetical protein